MTMYRVHRNDTKFIDVRSSSDKEARRLADLHPDLWETSVGRVHCTEIDSTQNDTNDNPQPKKGPTMTPHKHAALIKQWADGAIIQVRSVGKNPHTWSDVPNNQPSWLGDCEYRVKPETIQYKRFLWRSTLSHSTPKRVFVLVVTPEEQAREKRETFLGFIRWIDTEWQEVEV